MKALDYDPTRKPRKKKMNRRVVLREWCLNEGPQKQTEVPL